MSDPREETIAAYQAGAATYASGTAVVPESVARDLDDFSGRMLPGGLVLEIGSGPGRDARELERRGLVVRRTDITPAFVDLMRADGYDADVVDPLVDDLGGPWDGVWANAVLIHLARDEMPVVLARLHEATRPGGTLYASVQEGDGEGWTTRGHVAGARHFTFWHEAALREALARAGWRVVELRRSETATGTWLDTFAERSSEQGQTIRQSAERS
jgi:SAM-dependent methyltransferase